MSLFNDLGLDLGQRQDHSALAILHLEGDAVVVDRVARLGLEENTVVVYASDQGWMGGQNGMWGMGGWTGSHDDESMASLERAVDLGCNFFDTAWVYGQGRSERLLGRLLRKCSARGSSEAPSISPLYLRRLAALAAVGIPVIGNGDVRSPEDACAMVAQTGAQVILANTFHLMLRPGSALVAQMGGSDGVP